MEQKRGMCNLKKLSAFERMKINALYFDQSSVACNLTTVLHLVCKY